MLFNFDLSTVYTHDLYTCKTGFEQPAPDKLMQKFNFGDFGVSAIRHDLPLSRLLKQKHSPLEIFKKLYISGGEYVCLRHLLSDESRRIEFTKSLKMTLCITCSVVLLVLWYY